MKKNILITLFSSILIILLHAGNLQAVVYYVDSSKGNDRNPGKLTLPWKTIKKANITLEKGDTVFIRSGIYTDQIKPISSGSPENYITYKKYPEDPDWSVEIKSKTFGADLSSVMYIIIDGLYFNNCGASWVESVNGDYNIIKNCKFFNANDYRGLNFETDSDYNQILDNIFLDAVINDSGNYWNKECQEAWDAKKKMPIDCDRETAPADFIRIEDDSDGNVISGNIFGKCSHTAIAVQSKGNIAGTVIRNNTLSNYYHRNISIIFTNNALIEKNVISKASLYSHLNPSKRDRETKNGAGIKLLANDCIVRKNEIYDNAWGILYGGNKESNSNNSRIYNNTIYNNHWQIYLSGNSRIDYINTIVKNNIIFDDSNRIEHNLVNVTGHRGYEIIANRNDNNSGLNTTNYFINNSFTPSSNSFYFKNEKNRSRTLSRVISEFPIEWDENNISANPVFTDGNKKQLNLQSNSILINAGDWLTKIISATANKQNKFEVADSQYFYYGWEIPGEKGDLIKTEAGEVTTIMHIDYTSNIITVNPAIDIVENEGLALEYYDSRPDIGAHEFREKINNSKKFSAPTKLRIKSFNPTELSGN